MCGEIRAYTERCHFIRRSAQAPQQSHASRVSSDRDLRGRLTADAAAAITCAWCSRAKREIRGRKKGAEVSRGASSRGAATSRAGASHPERRVSVQAATRCKREGAAGCLLHPASHHAHMLCVADHHQTSETVRSRLLVPPLFLLCTDDLVHGVGNLNVKTLLDLWAAFYSNCSGGSPTSSKQLPSTLRFAVRRLEEAGENRMNEAIGALRCCCLCDS